jgi:hypothetical protein
MAWEVAEARKQSQHAGSEKCCRWRKSFCGWPRQTNTRAENDPDTLGFRPVRRMTTELRDRWHEDGRNHAQADALVLTSKGSGTGSYVRMGYEPAMRSKTNFRQERPSPPKSMENEMGNRAQAGPIQTIEQRHGGKNKQ